MKRIWEQKPTIVLDQYWFVPTRPNGLFRLESQHHTLSQTVGHVGGGGGGGDS